jgi:hypothetical protein
MKHFFKNIKFISVAGLLMAMLSFVGAQSPDKMSYQAVIRNAAGNLVTSSDVGVKISILKTSEIGTPVFSETHTATTNANGLISIEIGGGSNISGSIAGIDWSDGPYFIQVETDPDGGIAYSITVTSQLLTVPYALHAKTAETVETYSETDPDFNDWDKSNGISITESQISDLSHFSNLDETDPLYSASVASSITSSDTFNWNNPATVVESDPYYTAWDKSTGISITESQISDLDHFTNSDETDPVYTAWNKSSGISITESQISNLDHFTNSDETDQVFGASIASGITGTDTTYWNNKLDSYTETDPIYAAWNKSSGISITESQISDLNHFTNSDETDQVFGASIASGITGTDTTYWNNKLDSYTETDPVYGISVASSINTADTANWNAAASKHYIGELFGGGIIFYVYDNGQHGLIASLADLDGGTGWVWSDVTLDAGGAEATYFDGVANTATIIAQTGHTTSAAQLCDTYSNDGFTDWYLPSNCELILLAKTALTLYTVLAADGDPGTYGLKISNIPPYGNYWSSTGLGTNQAKMFDLRDNVILNNDKSFMHRVRAIRAF